MRGFSGVWPDVLSAVIAAARGVLSDLDDKEIPAALKRVAAYQGGKLPPPLASRLLRELDENDWLRDKVGEAWDGEDETAPALFLRRPPGWWVDLADKAASLNEDRRRHSIADLEAGLEQSESKRLAAVKRAREHKKAAEAAARMTKAKVESVKKTVAAKYSAEVAATAALREELSTVRRGLDEKARELGELQEAFAKLRSRLAKDRRRRIEMGSESAASHSVPADPLQLARLLDRQASELGRDLSVTVATPAPVQTRLAIAAGVRPDSSDAIRWLINLDEPIAVLVDGYNAQFHIDKDDFTSGSARRGLVEVLKRLRSLAAVQHRFVVVYDSTLPGERSARSSLGGVEVRFADEDRIADEEIVEMTRDLAKVVVISSDRAVRDGAEANGAVVLWSEALERWVRRS